MHTEYQLVVKGCGVTVDVCYRMNEKVVAAQNCVHIEQSFYRGTKVKIYKDIKSFYFW